MEVRPPRPESAAQRRRVGEILRGARSVIAAGHLPLDGDGLGSSLALVHALRAGGCHAVTLLGGDPPRNLRFLPGLEHAVRLPAVPRFVPDVFVALDGSALSRFGAMALVAGTAEHVVNIDHHVTNDGFGTACWVDASYAATGLMVYDLLRDLGLPIGEDAALCIYTALVTDTGRFSFSNTSPEAHEAAADLLRRGVRPDEVLEHVYRSVSPGRLELWAEVQRRLRVACGGRLAWSEITLEMCRNTGVAAGDANDLVEIPLSLEGVEVAAIFREFEESVHVSLRSKGAIDVAAFAAARGGGGHPRAAGFPRSGPVPMVRDGVVAELEQVVGGSGVA